MLPEIAQLLRDPGYTLVPKLEQLPVCQLLLADEPDTTFVAKIEAKASKKIGPVEIAAKAYAEYNHQPEPTTYKSRPPSSSTPNQRSTGRGGRGRLI